MKKLIRFFLGPFYEPMKQLYFYINKFLFIIFLKKKGTLVYLGLNTGETFSRIYYKYKTVIGFEPNPKNYSKLEKYNKHSGITIYPHAVSDKEGEFDFYLPTNENNDAAASLSDFTSSRKGISSRATIKVKTVNINNVLKKHNISFIDKYISDIEGFDFTVLKTLSTFLKKKRIGELQLEAFQNHVENPYKSVTNYEKQIDEFLSENYVKVARGWGLLKEGEFHDFRPDHSSIDLLFKLK